MTGFETLSMRKLSRDTASVMRAIKETQTSMVVTHYGQPVALLTPVSDRAKQAPGSTDLLPTDLEPTIEESDDYTEAERSIIRSVEAGISGTGGLTDATGIESGELSVLLGRCEMKGAIVKKPWGYFPKKPTRK